jgi:DNA-binding protein H-NS
MARSLTKIKQQIAQLQKQADSIQSSIIARIRKEIALHGLTAEHLFGSTAGTASAKERRPRVASAKSAGKPAKFADEQGNTWGGMGKRPQWIHDALSAGRSLDEFLVTAAKPAAKSKAKVNAKATPARKAEVAPARKKAATKRKPVKATAGAATNVTAPSKTPRKITAALKNAPAKKARTAKAQPSEPEASDQTTG